MKKTLAMLLTLIMVLALVGQAGTAFAEEADPMAELVAAAQAEGELVVYGSCEEDYLAAACNNFEKMYGKEKIERGIWFGKDLKDRYSVLWLYGDLFLNEKELEKIR